MKTTFVLNNILFCTLGRLKVSHVDKKSQKISIVFKIIFGGKNRKTSLT